MRRSLCVATFALLILVGGVAVADPSAPGGRGAPGPAPPPASAAPPASSSASSAAPSTPATSTEPAPSADPVDAQRAKEELLATELFNAGRDLLSAGQNAEACAKLAESARLSQKVGTLGKLAECDEKLGHLVAARGHFLQAQNLARATADDRLPIVERELARVDAMVPKLLLSTSGDAAAGIAITVDGIALGAGTLGVPIPLDPGRHTVLVSAPGKKAWTGTADLKADGKIVPIVIPNLVPIAVETAPSTSTAVAPAGRSPLGIAGLLVAGVGAGAMGVGAYFGGRAQGKLDESNRGGCVENVCTAEGATLRNQARTAGDLSTGLFITGAALLAGGVTLWIVSPPSIPTSKASVAMRFSPGSFLIEGSF